MPSLKDQLKNFLRKDGTWVRKNKITDDMRFKNQRTFKTYSSPTVDRSLRKLEEAKEIAVKYDEKGQAMYHFMPQEKKARYIPVAERENVSVYWRNNLEIV